jgi:tetratricopeptide (TPR) repeat protein
MSPLLDWGISSGIIEQFTELAKKWQQNEVTKLLISAVDAEDKDDFKEAINAYKKAKELVRDSNLNALIDFSLGNLYREACEYSDAIHHLSQAFSGLQNRIKPEDLASLETALGWLYYRAGNYSNAGKHFSQRLSDGMKFPKGTH